MKNKARITEIAKLLPEGLSESMVSDIAKVVDEVIVESVSTELGLLETRVKTFMRAQIDSLKEQALKELELENDTYRNAQLFESVKAIMAIELTDMDRDAAMASIATELKEGSEELNLITNELNEALTINSKYETAIGLLNKKVEKLTEAKAIVAEQVSRLEDSASQPFKSNEKAKVVSKADTKIINEGVDEGNPFITPEMLKLIN